MLRTRYYFFKTSKFCNKKRIIKNYSNNATTVSLQRCIFWFHIWTSGQTDQNSQSCVSLSVYDKIWILIFLVKHLTPDMLNQQKVNTFLKTCFQHIFWVWEPKFSFVQEVSATALLNPFLQNIYKVLQWPQDHCEGSI